MRWSFALACLSLGVQAAETVDLSLAQDQSVLGWVQGSQVFIAGEGGVNAGTGSERMFSHNYLTTITFGDAFYTGDALTMRYMFQGCSRMTALDLRGWDTSCVQNMASMFSGCSTLPLTG